MTPKLKPIKQSNGKKKRPPSERKILVKKLDDIVSLIVRKRDGQCVTPNEHCYGYLTCSHYYDRTNWGIRFDLKNCHAQCQGHNQSHNYHTYAYSEYMKKKYGNAIFGMLLDKEKKYRTGNKYTTPELREKLEELTKIYEEMK